MKIRSSFHYLVDPESSITIEHHQPVGKSVSTSQHISLKVWMMWRVVNRVMKLKVFMTRFMMVSDATAQMMMMFHHTNHNLVSEMKI